MAFPSSTLVKLCHCLKGKAPNKLRLDGRFGTGQQYADDPLPDRSG